jgi:hypothetical protein
VSSSAHPATALADIADDSLYQSIDRSPWYSVTGFFTDNTDDSILNLKAPGKYDFASR